MSDDNSLASEEVKVKLGEQVKIKANIMCSSVGEYDLLIICVMVGEMIMYWPHSLNVLLLVVEPLKLTSFELEMPYLLMPNARQAAVFIAENVDPSIVEIDIDFEMEGLVCIKHRDEEGKVIEHAPTESIALTKFGKRCELVLIYDFVEKSDSVNANINAIRKDGYSVQNCQGFQIPPVKKFGIMLLNQTKRLQQFQVVNPFPEQYSLEFNGRTHVVLPYGKYCIVREASEEPLELTMVERGWEEYPVKVVSSHVKKNTMKVQLKFDCVKWSVGNPIVVTADPPSFAMTDNSDWIVNAVDLNGSTHVFIPKIPGTLKMPNFQVGQQVCETIPKQVDIEVCEFPPFMPL